MKIISLRLGADDYAAGRTVASRILNPATQEIHLIINLSADNVLMDEEGMQVKDGQSTTTSGGIMGLPADFILADNDRLRVIGSSLAQDETLTIKLRARIWGAQRPTVTLTGSNMSIVETTDVMT